MCLVWGKYSPGINQMGQPKPNWKNFLYQQNGLPNGKEALSLSWIVISKTIAQFYIVGLKINPLEMQFVIARQ